GGRGQAFAAAPSASFFRPETTTRMSFHDSTAGWLRWTVGALALGTVGFHLWLVFSGLVPSLVSRPVHLALALPWVFLLVPYRSGLGRTGGALLCVAGIGACGWVALNSGALGDQYGSLEGWPQRGLAVLLLLIVL